MTPEALRAALKEHKTAIAACRACGISKQGAYKRADLAIVLREHFASERMEHRRRGEKRGQNRKLGERRIVLPPETVAYLDRLAADLAGQVGKRRGSRSEVARRLLEQALGRDLPALEAPGRWKSVSLDLGPWWSRLAVRIGTDDPEVIADTVRAILRPPAESPTDNSDGAPPSRA